MSPRMAKGKRFKVFQGVHARLVFLKGEDERYEVRLPAPSGR
jgi:hypothetical protein